MLTSLCVVCNHCLLVLHNNQQTSSWSTTLMGVNWLQRYLVAFSHFSVRLIVWLEVMKCVVCWPSAWGLFCVILQKQVIDTTSVAVSAGALSTRFNSSTAVPPTPQPSHSGHVTSSLTPAAGSKRSHFVASPEPSPEGGYVGQHSQGIGGHYAESYLAKRRRKLWPTYLLYVCQEWQFSECKR